MAGLMANLHIFYFSHTLRQIYMAFFKIVIDICPNPSIMGIETGI
jgi:hypothetical protein